jgi:hypothetical protein
MLPKAVGRDSATLCREKSYRTLKTDCLNDASLVSTDRDICSEFALSVFNLSAQPENFCAVPRLYPLILRFERFFPDDLDCRPMIRVSSWILHLFRNSNRAVVTS